MSVLNVNTPKIWEFCWRDQGASAGDWRHVLVVGVEDFAGGGVEDGPVVLLGLRDAVGEG